MGTGESCFMGAVVHLLFLCDLTTQSPLALSIYTDTNAHPKNCFALGKRLHLPSRQSYFQGVVVKNKNSSVNGEKVSCLSTT